MAIPDPPTDGKQYALRWNNPPGEWQWIAINPLSASHDLDFNGRRGRNAVASNLGGDYVTRGEIEGLIAAVANTLALKVDGSNQMLANANIGNNKLLLVGNGTAATDGVNKGQVDAAAAAAQAAAIAAASAALTAALAVNGIPTAFALFTTPGTYEWTKPAGVTTVYAIVRGGGGGPGGPVGSSLGSNIRGGNGGDGALIAVRLTFASASVAVPLTVGARGGVGNVGNTNNGGGGGGGGGASTLGDVVAGGGGGGSGGGSNGGAGGAGGVAGSQGGAGGSPGAAGSGGTAYGGAGAPTPTVSPYNGLPGNPGSATRGANPICGFAPPLDIWPTSAGLGGIGAGAINQNGTLGSHGAILLLWQAPP